MALIVLLLVSSFPFSVCLCGLRGDPVLFYCAWLWGGGDVLVCFLIMFPLLDVGYFPQIGLEAARSGLFAAFCTSLGFYVYD